jgi:hypothetical protein
MCLRCKFLLKESRTKIIVTSGLSEKISSIMIYYFYYTQNQDEG